MSIENNYYAQGYILAFRRILGATSRYTSLTYCDAQSAKILINSALPSIIMILTGIVVEWISITRINKNSKTEIIY